MAMIPSDFRASGASRPASGGAYKVDISRGERIGRVSSEWFSRPDDERFLSLSALHAAVRSRAERATARTVETKALRVEAGRDNPERLSLIVPGQDTPLAPTHWSYGQLCSLVGAPASYMRQLPAPLAGINLQHGLLLHRAELVKTLEADDGRIELRAVTGPDYGRIWDHELVEAVMRIAGDGTGDTRWKVPGLLDWSTMTHNPFVEVTKDTTTLYASDRDVFLFLVDDAHPIEAGRLPNGDPDLYFRGFYCWNSEVGSKTLGMASFYLRAVCMNRNIWGAEGFEEISIRHSKFAGHRFAHQAAPALERFATSSPAPFMAGKRRIWFQVDELDALGRIEGLKDAQARLRKFGGCVAIGFQSFAQVKAVYGEGAHTIIENCGNLLLLRAGASDGGGTAKLASDLIGDREVERDDVSRSRTRGRFTSRSMSMQTKRSIEDAALASEIMQLRNKEGFCKRATGRHWTKVTFPYVNYADRVSAFELRPSDLFRP